jgi:hypothetical protein
MGVAFVPVESSVGKKSSIPKTIGRNVPSIIREFSLVSVISALASLEEPIFRGDDVVDFFFFPACNWYASNFLRSACWFFFSILDCSAVWSGAAVFCRELVEELFVLDNLPALPDFDFFVALVSAERFINSAAAFSSPSNNCAKLTTSAWSTDVSGNRFALSSKLAIIFV